jgi:AcrR family transcriptional regulator
MAKISKEMREVTRQKLLAAAAQEFASAGLEGANINRISVSAGFAKGTVYNYFETKEALFYAVVREACALAAEGAHDDPKLSTQARLRALLESDLVWVRRSEAFAKVLVREALAGKPDSYMHIIDAAAPFLRRVEEVLRDGVARGEIRGDAPLVELALLLVGLYDLALIQHWGSGGAWPRLEDVTDLLLRQFLEGAAPRSPAAKEEQ